VNLQYHISTFGRYFEFAVHKLGLSGVLLSH